MFSWLVGTQGSGWDGVELFGNRGGGQSSTDDKIREIGQYLSTLNVWNTAKSECMRTNSPLRLLWWASLVIGARGQLTDPFPSTLELSSLDGTNGYIINGEVERDWSGYSVSSAGDINGDGLSDLVIGAFGAAPRGRLQAGKSFVLFGSRTLINGGTFELSSVNGINGFILNGEATNDRSGHSVSSVGDMNGDGLSDLVIGAYWADPSGRFDAGRSYVVFGSHKMVNGGTLELSNLNGTNGFMLDGEVGGDESGLSVSSAGDMNGDGLADIVIGAYQAAPSGRLNAGKSYVVFGSRTLLSGSTIELSSLDGTNGFVLNGELANDISGFSVSTAGDVNGDGLSDLLIGARYADTSGGFEAGKSYVVFGSSTPVIGGTFELASLNGTNGFILNGEAANDYSGYSVSSAGDMNGDGFSDLVIGAYRAGPLGRPRAGKSYVVFGNRTHVSGGTIELSSLNGQNGFTLNGEGTDDNSGWSVSSAGDMNGDGLSDLVIGAYRADPLGRTNAGKSYVVFGSRPLVSGGTFDLSSLDGQNGFILNGEATNDRSGFSVSSAGDVNGDGLSDLVIGARHATPSAEAQAGKSYVVFGRNFSQRIAPTSLSLDTPSPLTTNPITNNAQTTMSQSMASSSLAIELTPKNVLSSSSQFPTEKSTQSQASPFTSTFLLPQSTVNDSTPLIAGIAAAVAALVCSLLTGGIFLFRKTKQKAEYKGETQLENQDPLAGSVSNKAVQSEGQSTPKSITGHEYGQFPQSADYEKAPSPDHLYDQVIIKDQTNNNYQVVDESMINQEHVYDSPSSPL